MKYQQITVYLNVNEKETINNKFINDTINRLKKNGRTVIVKTDKLKRKAVFANKLKGVLYTHKIIDKSKKTKLAIPKDTYKDVGRNFIQEIITEENHLT